MEFIPRYLSPDADADTAASTSTSSPTSYDDDSTYNYDGYVPSTVDPDWWFTIYIIVGCILMNLSLPLWIYLGNRFGFHETSDRNKRRRRNSDWEASNNNSHSHSHSNNNNNYINDNNNNNNNTTSGEDALIKQLDEARSMISGYSHSHVTGGDNDNNNNNDYPLPPGSVVSGSIAMSRAGTHLGFHHRPTGIPTSSGSVFSGTSGFTDAVLGARPKRSRQATRRACKTKRIIVSGSNHSKSCVMGGGDGNDGNNQGHTHTRNCGGGGMGKLDVRMAAEFTKAEIDLLQQRNHTAAQQQDRKNGTILTPNTSSGSEVDIDVDFGNANLNSTLDDSRSDFAPSILSKLDADAISVRDAVDARDGDGGPLHMHTMLDDDGKMMTGDYGNYNYSAKNYNSAYGEHEHTHYNGYFSAVRDRLMAIADWDKEMKKYIALASHYSAQGILVEILGLVEIAVIGHYMGVTQANAYIIVGTISGFTGTITTGFYECAGVLIPQADGTRNHLMIGRYMQLGMFFYCLFAIPGAFLWSFYTERAVLWYGFNEETAKMGQRYLFATLPGFFTYGIDAVLYELLNTVGHESYCTWFTVISSSLHTGTVILMLYYWGVKDLYVLGLFETASGTVCLLLNFGIMVYKGWLDKYWEGLCRTNGLKDGRAVKNVFNTAIPLSFAWVLTYGEWEVMTFYCRYMGDGGAEVAAWGLMGYLWSAFETLTNGFGDAAEVRVGFRMGAGQVRLAKLASDKALYVSFTIAVYATGILFVLAMYIPAWLTPDPTLQRMLFDIIPLIGFGQILMVWGMVAWAILGAQGRIRTATALEFFISWGIGAPVAAILVFVFNYNIEGIVGGLTISYTIGTNVYLYMLHTSDWESLSAVVVARSAAEGQTYNEFDWDDLPDNIQEAAEDLGYSKQMWQGGGQEPESNDKSWDELTSTEQKAAGLLGYTKKWWNGDNETESSVDEKKSSDDSSDGASSVDWERLSKEAKSAAKVLGYTSSIWNNDGSTPAENKDWDELSPKERAAAKTLGYTEEKWNGEDDDESSNITPKPSEVPPTRSLTTRETSQESSVLDQIISDPSNVFGSMSSVCSFDSCDAGGGAEAVTSSIPSVTGISNGLSALFGFSIGGGEESKESSSGRKDT